MTFKLLPVIITVISQVMISSNLMIIRETANDEALFDRFYTYIHGTDTVGLETDVLLTFQV